MTTQNTSYKAHLLERLRNPARAIEYIQAAAEDGDDDTLQLAILDVMEAQRQAGAEDMRTRAMGACRAVIAEHADAASNAPRETIRQVQELLQAHAATQCHELIGRLAIMPFEVDPV